MSRWTEQFEAHAFQTTWANLKDALGETVVDDKTIFTSVSELARLRKVIEYLDGIIRGVDTELLPLSIWEQCNQQAMPCLQQISTYNIGRNIAHINQANNHADALLTFLRPYMIFPKEAAASMKRAATIYAKTVEEYVGSFQKKSNELVTEIEGNKLRSDELISLIEPTKESLDQFEEELFGEEGLQSKIRELVDNSEEKYTSIGELYNEVLVGDENELSAKKAISLAKDSILEEKEKIDEMMESISAEVNNLKKFHIRVFGKKDAKTENPSGISADLDALKQALVDFESKQEVRYKALNDEIESLLPGATSAGLATAYRILRRSFSKPVKLYSKIFYGSLAVLFMVSLFFVIDDISWTYIKFVDISNLERLGNNILYKLPLFLPVIWLAIFASKRRSEAQRLQQEYAHKEALAKSYQNFKQQIDDLGEEDNEMQKALILKAIDAIAHNAAETLDGKHGDRMPAQEMFESAVDAAMKLGKPK